MKYNKVCILGLGYIGLPTASMLAYNGFQVIGVDKKENLLSIVNQGESNIEEPGLQKLVHATVKSGFLRANNKPEMADVFIIAVPTPIKKDCGEIRIDLSYVEQASKEIVPYLRKGNLVILESTSPPGTTKGLVAPILEKSVFKVGKDIYLAHCPERVMPGDTLRELIQNNRIIGGINGESSEKAKAFYEKFVEGEISITDATTAEMVKLIENTYRDVNIALANELSAICEKAGINVWETIKLANLHPRVNVHLPGPGVGGHCISVDPWFIIRAFEEEAKIIALARQTNENQPEKVIDNLKAFLDGISNPVVTIMGVAYKGNIDDVRESPALKVIEGLKQAGIKYKIYDPHVSNFDYETKSLKEAFEGSDCAVVLADHDEFRFLCPKELALLMRSKQVYDTRCCLDRALWEEKGFKYFLLGAGIGGH